jgi:hypothetical protein
MSALGAYGLRVAGIPEAARWMQPQPEDAPLLEVVAEQAPEDRSPSRVDEQQADLGLLDGGRLRATRGEGSVRFSLPVVPPDADLLHPYLAPAAALTWQWNGHEALHAGSIVVGGGAVLVIGEKEAGKSTTLAWLARTMGVTVVSDDLAVLRGEDVLAGPRSIDLRPGPKELDGVVVRGGGRLRVDLPPAPPAVPVVGSVVLRWGPELAMESVPATERIRMLGQERSYYRLHGDPAAILNLAGKPMFTLVRPREEAILPAATQSLLRRFDR